MRRVVITGLGIVAPTGNDVASAWEAAVAGRSAVGRISLFDASQMPVRIAAEVRGFDPTSAMSVKDARQSSRFVQFACAASKQALDDSGLDTARVGERTGCIIGAGIGGIGEIEEGAGIIRERGPSRIPPHLLPYAIPNMAAGFAAILSHLQGPSFCVASACASGTNAIGEAYMHIVMGNADAMLAGGAEAAISPLCVASFSKIKALSTQNENPHLASRPFDLNRDGFVMGEGSGMLVLEELEQAVRRGAKIYAELVGYGSSCDAYHITMPAPGGAGLVRSIKAVLQAAAINVAEVDYINAHGTSTQANDALESEAILSVFGQQAHNVSISSTKGVTGHCLGAAGGIEAIYTALAVHSGTIPPTANYETADPACPLDYTPNQPRERRIRYALSNSSAFGGQNACIALKHFE